MRSAPTGTSWETVCDRPRDRLPAKAVAESPPATDRLGAD